MFAMSAPSNLRPVTLAQLDADLVGAFFGRSIAAAVPADTAQLADVGAETAAVVPAFFQRDPADVARDLVGWAHSRSIAGILNGMTGLAWDEDQWGAHFGGDLVEGAQGPIPTAVWQHARAVEILLVSMEAAHFAQQLADAAARDREDGLTALED